MKTKNYLKSFGFAFKGLYSFFGTEANAWIHSLAAGIVLFVSYLSALNTQEWLWILLAIALVFITEMFNTALEKLADKVEPEQDRLIELSKDISAGATLIASIFALVVGLIVLLPKWI